MATANGETGSSSDLTSCPPLEARLVEDDKVKGAVTKFPAVNKRFTSTFRSIQFFLPNLETLHGSESALCLVEWAESMEIYLEDLKWLLKLPYNKFWSFVIHSKEIAEEILSSFLLRAPRSYDPNFQHFYNNDIVWPLYNEIYSYIFRIYMRLSVVRESKNEYITPAVWGAWLHDNYILDVPKLLDLCDLYDVEGTEKTNEILVKMIENIFKHEPRFYEKLKAIIPLFLQKLDEPNIMFSSKIQNMVTSENIDEHFIQDLLTFQIDTLASLYKFLKHFNPAARILYEFPQFLNSLANSYESTVKLLGSAVVNLPHLQDQLALYRSFALLLFRTVLSRSTILPLDMEHECDLDGFFNCLTACLDNKTFIYDYTKAYPFIWDIEGLMEKGIIVDETRVAYVHNAISACYNSFGERFPELSSKFTSKMKVEPARKFSKELDPLLDPNFDRQLLGACSVEVTGPEFNSLVSQVKDLFAELPTRYVEVCIKYYGYKTEDVINAILEGSVPSYLDKYKDDSSSNEFKDEYYEEDQSSSNNETFHKGKWSHGITSDQEFLDANKSELKTKIIESLQVSTDRDTNTRARYSYVDESLLPTFDQQIEYEDEYDDTYDEGLMGTTDDPESWLYNPLNRKADEEADRNGNNNDAVQEEESQYLESRPLFDHFVEDPAVVRERMERKRQEKYQQKKKFVPIEAKDVVGKAKGQGQDKEVLANRRHKEASKEVVSNHSRKKQADWKRREF